MSKHLWGTTFKPGDYEALQRELFPHREPVPLAKAVNALAPARGLFHSHACTVQFVDGKVGNCTYERKGPTWHVFHYFYPGQWTRSGQPAELAMQVWQKRMDNDRMEVECLAQTLSADAFAHAVASEQQHYFARASPDLNGNPPRQADKSRFTTDAKTAKEWAGKYALCWTGLPALRFIGNASATLGRDLFNSVEAANNLWRTGEFPDAFGTIANAHDHRLVVACFNRLDRCWELPFFNPLYTEHDLRETYFPYLPQHRQTQWKETTP